jgi:hypothetical protein
MKINQQNSSLNIGFNQIINQLLRNSGFGLTNKDNIDLMLFMAPSSLLS